MVRRIIGGTFKSGYDEVRIEFNTNKELSDIQKVVREHFTGFEIVNQTKGYISVKNISQTDFSAFETVLRRFFLIINQIAEDTYEAYKENDHEWLKNIALMKIESDKCADFLRKTAWVA